MQKIAFGPFRGFVRNKYKVIYADPAWKYKVRSDKGEGRSAGRHYKVMDLSALKKLPVKQLAAKDCVLLMWTTDTHLPHALELMKSWGFKYSTIGFHWVKLNKDGTPFTGMGHWTRANVELCLLGTRGRPPRVEKDVRRLIMARRREHSRKPDETYHRIERLVDGPYVELFARQVWPGWDAWGNETGKFKPFARWIVDILG